MYNGADLIEESDYAGNLAARYVFGSGIDEPLAANRSATWEFYQADGLGSVAFLSTTTGTVSDSFLYDSFGNVTSFSGAFDQPFRYTGRERDQETDLYYYRARYYDSTTGRFLSEDPIGFDAGNNFYSYVLNNPVNLRDPSGKKSLDGTLPWLIPTGRGIVVSVGIRSLRDGCHRRRNSSRRRGRHRPFGLWCCSCSSNRSGLEKATPVSMRKEETEME